MVEISKCDNYDEARKLFIEYYKLKGAEVCFVSFENELKNLEEVYSSGVILLAKEADKLTGCIAVKKIEDGICELKRLLVRGVIMAMDTRSSYLRKQSHVQLL